MEMRSPSLSTPSLIACHSVHLMQSVPISLSCAEVSQQWLCAAASTAASKGTHKPTCGDLQACVYTLPVIRILCGQVQRTWHGLRHPVIHREG